MGKGLSELIRKVKIEMYISQMGFGVQLSPAWLKISFTWEIWDTVFTLDIHNPYSLSYTVDSRYLDLAYLE